MIKLAEMLQNQSSPYTVYHGTKSAFRAFNLKNAPQPIIWFTTDRNEILAGNVGAAGKGYIITAKVTINNPAGWPEYEKYGLGELQSLKYDGAILPSDDGQFDCFVFSPKQIKILKVDKV